MKMLNESDLKKLIESPKAMPLTDEREISMMETLLENQANYIVEDSTSADIGTFTKILVPAVRRIFPALFAKNLVSIQPLSTPTGFCYAQRFFYKGSKTNPISYAAKVITYTGPTAVVVGDVITAASGATGTVVYVETGKLVVDTITGVFAAGDLFDVGAAYAAGANDNTVSAVYSSQIALKQVLKNYSGSYLTAAGEALGNTMNEVGFKIDKISVEAKTRKLKSNYTTEFLQDLQSQHGMNAEKELLNLLQYEVQSDIDREILDVVKANATLDTDVVVSTLGGRWEAEKFGIIYTRILKMCEQIAVDTKRGAGNVMVASPNVIAALSLTKRIKFSSVDLNNNVNPMSNVNVAFVGTLDNGVKVYRDVFATSDYILVGYKGATPADAGVIFSPYTPLQIQRATDPTTLQPVIGVSSRYGITQSPLVEIGEANPYYRTAAVSFTGTSLA